MTRIAFATLYDFSYEIFNNNLQAKRWRDKVTSKSYMGYWRDWLGDYSYTRDSIYYKFCTHNIIVAYQPYLLPDWSTSMVAMMFYRKYVENSQFYRNPLYMVTFMDRRIDFWSEDIDYKFEFSPKLEYRFLQYLNDKSNNENKNIYLIENRIHISNFLDTKLKQVSEYDSKEILRSINFDDVFCNNLFKLY